MSDAALPPGVVELGGDLWMRDVHGKLNPLELVKASDKLEDEVVRDLMARAEELSAAIAKFRDAAFGDVDTLLDILFSQHKTKKGGAGGNVELNSFDGTLRVEVQVSKLVTYGPQLEIAKTIVDECLTAWGAGSRPEIRAIVADAFDVDQKGKVNRQALLRLKRLDIEDARWQEAMRLISEAEKPDGTKRYIRFKRRASAKAPWQNVSLDAASA
jgi:hypothetical protein